MMANVFLRPAFFRGAVNGLDITFGGVCRFVVPGVAVFPKRDSRTDGVADGIVLTNPAFAPMRADQTDLFGRGRRPRSGGLPQNEAADRNVVDPRLVRIKHCLTNTDPGTSLVGVEPPELCPKSGVLLAHLSKPKQRANRPMQHVF